MTDNSELLERLARIEAHQEQAALPPGIHPATGIPLPPIIIAPDSVAGRKAAADVVARDARRAAAEAEDERLRLEREAEERAEAKEFERRRPQREAAQRELAIVRAELHALDQQLEPLRRRASALQAIASGD
jgi:hypothetical protein